ncbi:GNAT family N-acetyltransferase [Alkalicoccus chagannorensis]|uniref:GNAT family N-acetyltransferase n=1 Tax=Alkalicoccus chagannorensis TaxID=427072 RepID=UPI000428642E|nr:GNAT family protein [Alkalicoccus chagannorensis]
MHQQAEVTIRPIEEKDLYRLWELIYKEEAPEWKKWDAPYFRHEPMSWAAFQKNAEAWIGREDTWVIDVDGTVMGTVSYYYEDVQRNWLEAGIILHESSRWNQGVGTIALRLWLDHLFATLPLVRAGITTWSGNKRMMRVAEKMNMKLEGRIRQVRYYDGDYYDSIRMGVLREEWQKTAGKNPVH